MKCSVCVVLCLLLAPLCLAADKNETQKPAQSIEELQKQLEKILTDTHTPGVSIAIVHRNGPEWVAGLGQADVASGRATTPETLFRIGSTSKAFTSMAILMLVDQGRLSLNDPVRKLAPEVWFENRWEATDPVRVVNLLEHTTGWDDMHFREYAKDGPNIGLREALDYDHHSRISRWPPGTRMAYCNSGPAVAAYIVEKLTKQRFEDFVEKNLFLPIGMKTATYFKPGTTPATTLYHYDGKTPYRYWNIIYRPAGSINASAQDMAAYVQFYLNRGSVQVVPDADIDRMENPTSTWAARQGLKAGYGLSNYWTIRDGFVFHGHNGGVEGGLTDMAYMPDYGVGYFFSINAGNPNAFRQIGNAVRAYITRGLPKPSIPPVASLPPDAAAYAGWYEPDSPRNEMTHFLERLVGLSRVHFGDGKLLMDNLGRINDTYLPVTGDLFRPIPRKDPPGPAASLALITPNEEGRFIDAATGNVMKRIPAWLAFLEIVLTAFVLLSMLSILLYAPFWILGGLSKKRRRPAERSMRAWPLLATLSLCAVVVIFILAGDDLITNMGNLTAWSGGLFLATILFALASLAGAIAVWRAPADGVRRSVWRYSAAVTAALVICTAYLAYWGVIGFRIWA
ncbi:MAG: beta-lactamase family protein [Acidobacteriia bacterium]|nr:beta-lactamase family protein [Terriglobia bacterium]